MKIHMHSYVFPPSVGGVEAVGELLVKEWLKLGVEVRVSTQTMGQAGLFPFPVLRCPGNRELLRLTKWADVVFHNHPSARAAWAPILCRKPWYAAVHNWLPCYQGGGGASLIHRGLFKSCRFLAISDAIAGHLPEGRTQRVPNPYRADVYKMGGSHKRDLDLLFVGRLVSDKGVFVLIEALAKLNNAGHRLHLEIIGDGPEKPTLESLCENLGLRDQVSFSGVLSADHIASRMNRARFTVIPSVWQEPFGLVALEALACGSVPVVAQVGGLPEAVGDFGEFFKAGDAASLAAKLDELLGTKTSLAEIGDDLREHLSQHHPTRVAACYLKIFNDVLSAKSVFRQL
jgi:glycosyltransferase involved in cell wall biosynthesis